MTYNKTILCLANSRKHSGRCVAGRELVRRRYRSWIRPISNRPSAEISEEDSRYEDGQAAQVLHVIRIPMLRPAGETYQTENHIIDDDYYWEKVGTANWDVVASLVEDVSAPLWINGHSTYNGLNDQVPEAEALTLDRSLILVQPANPQIWVRREGGVFGPAKRRVRASFSLGRHSYLFQVTDPVVEARYLARDDGVYRIDDAVLCISLGELWNGHAYKLVATVLTPE